MKAKILIFKCKQCGETFLDIPPKDEEINIERIARHDHIVSTHKCKDDVYGVGELIGACYR